MMFAMGREEVQMQVDVEQEGKKKRNRVHSI